MTTTKQQSHNEWLASLKPGDEAILHRRWDNILCPVVITRRTAANIWYRPIGSPEGYESRFAKGDRVRLEPVTPEALAEIERRKLIDWFQRIDPRMFPVDKLAAAKQVLMEDATS